MAAKSDALPGVSYVMPVLNEVQHIEAAINSLTAQDYAGDFEIILALGPSVDGTNDIVSAMAAADPRIRRIDNELGSTPGGLNVAIRASVNPVVIRVDAHSVLPPDYTRVALAGNLLESAGIASFIRNEQSHNLITGIPIALFEPKLCVMRDEDAAQAREIIANGVAAWTDDPSEGTETGEEWTCAKCGETVPVAYGSCWNCEATREDPAADGS